MTVEFVTTTAEDETELAVEATAVEFVVPYGGPLDISEIKVVTTPEIVVTGATVGEPWAVELPGEAELAVGVFDRADEPPLVVLEVEVTVVVVTAPTVPEVADVPFDGAGKRGDSGPELIATVVVVTAVTVPTVPEMTDVAFEEAGKGGESELELFVTVVVVATVVIVPTVPEIVDVPFDETGKGGELDAVTIEVVVAVPGVAVSAVPEMLEVPLPGAEKVGRGKVDSEVREIVLVDAETTKVDVTEPVPFLPETVGPSVATVPVEMTVAFPVPSVVIVETIVDVSATVVDPQTVVALALPEEG